MWRDRLIAGAIVAALFVVGLGFLIASAYLALQASLGAPVAASLVGAGLVGSALLVLLIAMLLRPPSPRAPIAAPPATSEQTPLALEGLMAPELAQNLAVVMRNLNPVTLAVVLAGALYGYLRR